jgi:hypothetical protein
MTKTGNAKARLHLQDRRLPLQSLHLKELRLLIRDGPRPRGRGPVCAAASWHYVVSGIPDSPRLD